MKFKVPRFSVLILLVLAAFLMGGFGCRAGRQPETVIPPPVTAPCEPCPPTPVCQEPEPPPVTPAVLPMLPAESEALPDFSADDLDMVSLKIAMDYSREYLNRFKPDRLFTFGPDTYTAADLLASLDVFEGIATSNLNPEEFNRAIREKFTIYRSTGSDGKGAMLFTGYYEPVMEGSLTPGGPYKYPIYRRPDDLVRLDLGIFSTKWKGDVIYGRVDGLGFVPYYDRKAIDGDGVLAGRGLEIAWVKDDIALFFFHIQGSGRVVLPDGREMRVQYDAENGRPFRSIGGLLIREGKLTRDKASMDGIRAYVDANPRDRDRVLFYNPSYIFYRVAERGPLGLTEVPMTPGRSIATDRRLFPMGALCFIRGQKLPLVDPATGRVTGYRPFSRFVANQDTGGAIRSPGRLDLFFGSGLVPEKGAGSMKSEGEMFFLVLKSAGGK
ncbi:MAG: MltA domain-containing protein [Deltaproteobacteria bacterium]|nr:MltA domain-containing protein [Deltaproteobacteria bacterium]